MKFHIKETLRYFLRSDILIKNEIREVEQYFQMSNNDLLGIKEKKFINLFKLAYNKSEFYRQLYKKAGISIDDIKSLNDLSKLPILTKDMVRENHEKILTSPKWKVIVGHTSGTTGSPLTVYQNLKAIHKEQAYLWVNRKKYGFTYGEPLVSLRGQLNKKEFKKYIKLSNTLFLSAEKLNRDSIKKYYKNIIEFKPKAIEGYPSTLYYLSLFLRDKKLHLEIPYTFTSSETLFDFQRDIITEVLNTNVYDYYGCTEKAISLSENIDHSGYFENPAYSINEYKDNQVICTSLINESFPLIRYCLNDRIIFKNNCQGIPFIHSIDGRAEDVIIDKNGSIISRWNNIFKGLKNVTLAQILQKEKGEIVVNIVPDGFFSIYDEKEIFNRIDKKIGLKNINVEIKIINESEILYTSRNKYRLVISEL